MPTIGAGGVGRSNSPTVLHGRMIGHPRGNMCNIDAPDYIRCSAALFPRQTISPRSAQPGVTRDVCRVRWVPRPVWGSTSARAAGQGAGES